MSGRERGAFFAGSRTHRCGVGTQRADRSARGFTLIELMVVVAVVAILAAVALPSYQEHVRKSRRGQAQADLVELAQRAERFHTVNSTYVGFWATVPAGHKRSPREGGGAFYNIDMSGVSAGAFTLTASPVAGTAQANDRCGPMRLDQTGRKSHGGGAERDAECRFGNSATSPPTPPPTLP